MPTVERDISIGEAGDVSIGDLQGHVIHAGLMVNNRPEDGVDREVLHALAVDPDFAAVAQAGAILVSGSDHACPLADLPRACYRSRPSRKTRK